MQKRLSEIVRRPVACDPMITGVTADSRAVRPGALFAALPGTRSDGRVFAPAAIRAGAAAVLAPIGFSDARVPVIPAHDPRRRGRASR